jgi:hypothetical protein
MKMLGRNKRNLEFRGNEKGNFVTTLFNRSLPT